MSQPIRIGIDTGGTFTDFVVSQGSRLTTFKLSSTPANPADSILEGVARILADYGVAPSEIVHGTTVATNALLERKGARAALITTEGFEDVLEIGRQARPELYNLMVTRPAPLIPRELRFGANERTGPDGAIIKRLDKKSLKQIIREIKTQKVESIAVCLLFSFTNPAHEQQIADALASLDLPVSLSHKILPEYREYERTSTVVINAYLVPLMSRYLRSLNEGLLVGAGGRGPGAGDQRLGVSDRKTAANFKNTESRKHKKTKETKSSNRPPTGPPTPGPRPPAPSQAPGPRPLRVMQSNGGSVSAETAAAEPVRAILSGPAGGVVGALRVSTGAGIRDIITFDMGGTSTDVALCRGEARTTNEALVADLPVAVPIIDIHTVGAGGGSIARVDEAGALRVGPESAGAEPGPACYGRGEQVTVTDANLVLGRFGGSALLGGEMRLDLERARHFLSELAADMSRFSREKITPERAALGVIRVANANMERALRVVSVERGQDPRLFTLVSFGGAGGLHVSALAEALRIPRVLVPRSPGTLSALGVLLGDVVKDYSRTVMMNSADHNFPAIERVFAALEREAESDLAREGFKGNQVRLQRLAAMRYVGQSFEIEVPWNHRFESAFHKAHAERYGYSDHTRPGEIVSLRVRATGLTDKPRFKRSPSTEPRKIRAAYNAKVYLTERAQPTPVYLRDDLMSGDRFRGPAIIAEYSSTTLIPKGRSVEVDPFLNLIIT